MSLAIHKAEIVFHLSLRDQQRTLKRLADGQRQGYVFMSSIISIAQNVASAFRVKHCNYMSSI